MAAMCLHQIVDVEWGWLVLSALGAAVLLFSVLRYSRAHPRTPFAFFRRQPAEDGAALGLRAAGIALSVFGTLMFSYAFGSPWIAGALILTAYLPSAATMLIHNRTVKSRTVRAGESARVEAERSAGDANN
jgi:hypothetical protein